MIIKSLIKIFESMEGVNIIDVKDVKKYPHIRLTISSSQSRLLVIYCAEASNIIFNSYTSLIPTSKEALDNPDIGVEYQYRAESLDEFQNLGAFLIWNLYDLGQIEIDIADEFLSIFQAISINERRKSKILRDNNE